MENFTEGFELTGPEALDHTEVAKIISDVTGRKVVYHSPPEEQMLTGAGSHGMPESIVEYLGMLYGGVRSGLTADVSGDFEQITGRAPMTFEAFARASARAWKS